MAILACILAAAFIWGAVSIVRYKPPQKNSRRFNALIAVISAALLLYLNIPWTRIAFNRFSSEQKDALASKHFDPAYSWARRAIENCKHFKNSIGGLKSLDISERNSFVRSSGDQTRAFFDFNYVGGDSSGHFTTGFLFRKSGDTKPPGLELVMPRSDEPVKEIRLLIYPEGRDKHQEVRCPGVDIGGT